MHSADIGLCPYFYLFFYLRQLSRDDLTTWKRDVAYLTGIACTGVVPL